MKERITYINVDNNAEFDPSHLQVKGSTLHVQKLKAARELHLTFSLEELPVEIKSLLHDGISRLNLRWTSPEPYIHAAPFASRTPSGLYISVASQTTAGGLELCPILHAAFGQSIKCVSIQDSFTAVNTTRTSSSIDTLEYHHNLESLSSLVTYIKEKICLPGNSACLARTTKLENANSLDIDFDHLSSNLVVRISEGYSEDGISAQEMLDGSSRSEVGILGVQQATDADHVKLGGYLVTLGEDDKLKPTLFQFPSRHHAIDSKFAARFIQPTGLHPTLQISLASSASFLAATRPDTCSLYTYLALPSTTFPDKYQLSNDLLLETLKIKSVQSISGYTDLEAPEYAVSAWGSSMLLELEYLSEDTAKSNATQDVNIPLHLRYLPPTDAANRISSTDVPWPVVFWACKADIDTGKLTGNPFDRINLGYDTLFDHDTIFYHWQPATGVEKLVNTLHVPVLSTGFFGLETGILEMVTGVVVLTGWLWVVWLLFKGYFTQKPYSHAVKEKKDE